MATRSRNAKPATSKPEAEAPTKFERNDQYGEREDGALAGNLTRDPELRYTPQGRSVASSSIACQDRVYNKETGQWTEGETEFYRVNFWGQLAENVVDTLVKGDRVCGTGYFQEHTWTAPDGEEKSDTEFTATDFGPSLLWTEATVKRVTRSKK